MIVLESQFLCKGWGGCPLCLGTVQCWWISIGLVIVQLRAVFCLTGSVYHSSVRHFPERSWIVVAFPCFTVVKSFTSLYAHLLLFFLRFSSVLLHCSIQFSFAFFLHLMMIMFSSLYFSDSSGSDLFFLRSLLLCDRSRISAVIHFFF